MHPMHIIIFIVIRTRITYIQNRIVSSNLAFRLFLILVKWQMGWHIKIHGMTLFDLLPSEFFCLPISLWTRWSSFSWWQRIMIGHDIKQWCSQLTFHYWQALDKEKNDPLRMLKHYLGWTRKHPLIAKIKALDHLKLADSHTTALPF